MYGTMKSTLQHSSLLAYTMKTPTWEHVGPVMLRLKGIYAPTLAAEWRSLHTP
jgi:hypothetical protein